MTYDELLAMSNEDGQLPCGFYNGVPCYSHEEFVYRRRERELGRFGAIENDDELIEFAWEREDSHDNCSAWGCVLLKVTKKGWCFENVRCL